MADGFCRDGKSDALQVVGVGVGASPFVDLHYSDDAYLHASDVEYLIGYSTDACCVVGEDIGADIAEIRQGDEPSQRAYIELVVAQRGGVVAHLVHQRHHWVGGYLEEVVQRVACTVVACR